MDKRPFWDTDLYKAKPEQWHYGVIRLAGGFGGGWVDWYAPHKLGPRDKSHDLWVRREMIPQQPWFFD